MTAVIQNSFYRFLACLLLILAGSKAHAQTAPSFGPNGEQVHTTVDPRQVLIGDQARVFLEVQLNPAKTSVRWPSIPDSFARLEVIEKGKIDTFKQGNTTTYKQRLLVSGFDSGVHIVPAFVFDMLPTGGAPYTLTTDSIPILVQTVAVDTTKAIKPIKAIIDVRSTWRDYIWWIVGAAIFIVLAIVMLVYFIRSKRIVAPVKEDVVKETLQEKAMRMLQELESRKVWQNGQVKDYYVALTDIVRGYIEARFDTAAMELTTDELLDKAKYVPGIQQIVPQLSMILRTADLAKFAKAQPSPQEHVDALQMAKDLVSATRPVIIENTPTTSKP